MQPKMASCRQIETARVARQPANHPPLGKKANVIASECHASPLLLTAQTFWYATEQLPEWCTVQKSVFVCQKTHDLSPVPKRAIRRVPILKVAGMQETQARLCALQ